MKTVDTLVVFATNRGAEVAADQLAALAWSFSGSHYAVVVDDDGRCGELPKSDQYTVIRSRVPSRRELSGFKNHEGILWALDRGIDFARAFCLDDDCLPIGRGPDAWAAATMEATAADLLGTRDRVSYRDHWPGLRPFLGRWLPEAAGWHPLDRTVFYAACWLGRPLVDEMAGRGLLLPDGYASWPTWPDVYVSWAAQLLGFATTTWGSMDRPRPPLYLNHPATMDRAPQPWILHPGFACYHSVRSVPGFSERAVRAYYAGVRTGAAPDPHSPRPPA